MTITTINTTTEKQRTLTNHHHYTPVIVWFTGLSASGKSSTATAVAEKLSSMGCNITHLDGDEIRRNLCADLGFSDKDRSENIRRIAEAAKTALNAGKIVLVSVISPFQADRLKARHTVAEGEFIEVYMSASLSVCEERDPKKLYQKARAGDIKHFTGIDSAYEVPENPDIIINSAELSRIEACEKVIKILIMLKVISSLSA